MNRNLWLLALCQGLFLTNNVTFIAINGLVGLALAPYGWMATLPVMGYVVGGALATPLVRLFSEPEVREKSVRLSADGDNDGERGEVAAAAAAAIPWQ